MAESARVATAAKWNPRVARPTMAADSAPAWREEMHTETAESKATTFVVVEDDPFDCAYLADALATVAPKARVVFFDDLAAALHTLAISCAGDEDRAARVILMLDAALLIQDRHALSEALRRLRPIASLRVVALLNADDYNARRRAFLAGADEVMCRPADPVMLARLGGVEHAHAA